MTEIEKRIMTKKRFSEAVEKQVKSISVPWKDAVIIVCENKEMDRSEVKGLLSEYIKGNREVDAMQVN